MTDSTVSTKQAKTTSFTCSTCGQVFCTLDNSYLHEYPNSSDIAVADAELFHRAHECPNREEFDTVDYCKLCGEEVWRGDCEYVTNNPTGSDQGREEAMDRHLSQECPVAWKQNWADWREAAGAYKFEKPWQLIDRRMKEGWNIEQLLSIPLPPDRQDQDDWLDEIELNIISNLAEQQLAKWKQILGTIPEGVSVSYGMGITDAEGRPWHPDFQAVHYRRAAALGIKI